MIRRSVVALVILASLSTFSCEESTSPKVRLTPIAEVPIDARSFAVVLDSTSAARLTVPPGTYPFMVWGTSGVPACVVFSSPEGTMVQSVYAGANYSITIGEDSVFYAFFLRSDFAVDTLTELTFDLGLGQVTARARENFIVIDSSNSAFVAIPGPGQYDLSFGANGFTLGRGPVHKFIIHSGNWWWDYAATYSTSARFDRAQRMYFVLPDVGSRMDNAGTLTARVARHD